MRDRMRMYLDLSQSITRCRNSLSDIVPCITPGSRLWKRRQGEWLLAPEAMLIQGLDPSYVRCLTSFSHRQVLDLMGNAFNSTSFLIALVTAFSCAELAIQRTCDECARAARAIAEGAECRGGMDLEAALGQVLSEDEDNVFMDHASPIE